MRSQPGRAPCEEKLSPAGCAAAVVPKPARGCAGSAVGRSAAATARQGHGLACCRLVDADVRDSDDDIQIDHRLFGYRASGLYPRLALEESTGGSF